MKLATDEIREVVARALAEDLGSGDVTSEAVVPEDDRARGSILQKQDGVLYGLELAAEAFRQAGAEAFDPLLVEGQWREGDPVVEGESMEESRIIRVVAARVSGPARALLGGERTALNFLGHLSGIATLTARFVEAVEGTGARILDTRKTTPGLRALEKAAVTAGGGHNHRMGLYDAILIKDNHVDIAGGVGEAVRRAREAQPDMEIEVECRNNDEIREAIGAGADRLLLDNFVLGTIAEAKGRMIDWTQGGQAPVIEISGRVNLENVRELALGGVDFISVGALTHSAPALDLSMEMEAG